MIIRLGTKKLNQPNIGARAARGSPFLTLIFGCLLWTSSAYADTQTSISYFEYDADGSLIKEVVEPDSANECRTTGYSYDMFGNRAQVSVQACPGATGEVVSSATSPRLRTDSYDSTGRYLASSKNSLSHSESKTYDKRFGLVSGLTGPNNLKTNWEYDGFGRKTKELRADGTFATWTYLRCNEQGAVCPDPLNANAGAWVLIKRAYAANGVPSRGEQRGYYDALDRIVRIQTKGFDAEGTAPTIVRDTQYDSQGRIWRESGPTAIGSAPESWKEYSFDALNRVIRLQTPDPTKNLGVAVTSIIYNGLSTSITNAKGQSETTLRNASGQVTQITDAQGAVLSYGYNARGNLTQANAAGLVTTMAYDRRGRKTSMADPSTGAWEYRYNVHDEPVWQRDSLGQITTLFYDALGRTTRRVEPDLVSEWSYEKKFDGVFCGKSIGKICQAKSDNGYNRTYTYDGFTRLSSIATVLDSPATPALTTFSYDPNNVRLIKKTLPAGYEVNYSYTPGGYLKRVTGGGSNGFIQTASIDILSLDARNNITRYRQGDQLLTAREFEPSKGYLKSQSVTQTGQAVGNVLQQSYGHDVLGNLISRSDTTPGVETRESFSYDALNRLQLYTILGDAISPPQTTQVLFDALGNITYKSDVGRYAYDPTRPSRLISIVPETVSGGQPNTGTRTLTYAFDDNRPGAQSVNGISFGNGNLAYTVSRAGSEATPTVRWSTQTSFNMPREVNFGSLTDPTNPPNSTAQRILSFAYGPEHQRVKQQVQLSAGAPSAFEAGTTWYLQGGNGLTPEYEKEVLSSGKTEHKYYLSAGGIVFAIQEARTGTLGTSPASSVRYLHHDHLGSISAITDESGSVVERLAYDPWGKRRHVDGRADASSTLSGISTERGYTMHEHLDEVGIVHMNGRLYDPLNARFMSADPFVDRAANLQNFNRYAYVFNNPLRNTDPSGYGVCSEWGGSAIDCGPGGFLPPVTTTETRLPPLGTGGLWGVPSRPSGSFGTGGFMPIPVPTPFAIVVVNGPVIFMAGDFPAGGNTPPLIPPPKIGDVPFLREIVAAATDERNSSGLEQLNFAGAPWSYSIVRAAMSVGQSVVSGIARAVGVPNPDENGTPDVGKEPQVQADEAAEEVSVPEAPIGAVKIPDGKFWKDRGIDPHEVKQYDSSRNLGVDKKDNVWSVDRHGSGNPQWEGTIDSLRQN